MTAFMGKIAISCIVEFSSDTLSASCYIYDCSCCHHPQSIVKDQCLCVLDRQTCIPSRPATYSCTYNEVCSRLTDEVIAIIAFLLTGAHLSLVLLRQTYSPPVDCFLVNQKVVQGEEVNDNQVCL